MDRDHLGGYTKGGPDNVLQDVQMASAGAAPLTSLAPTADPMS